jgi:hypothetical protein
MFMQTVLKNPSKFNYCIHIMYKKAFLNKNIMLFYEKKLYNLCQNEFITHIL